ncbi:Bifunctional protein BirA [Slackia heliotrinireducens]|uniref:BirA, biotin-(Acetyl-CoA-carboxylase) ligase n=1 Tax=Slackia heliotrinireducens (strain ATCC 29202 / DSM 20476 / NCTC 11029 / RHS 1) TaxID=471855 RepID=C7N1I4_SLAHD|nr:biotin--[acetyl-CoA-carboxylase] ligase [Slackia heliotrinireducens]ACV21276.1 birA, biotin-(acetyl-CoA-carboxylase) ligase [Slackia heliotrinireducens DSM 20476]VEG98711.1 Bifunctional protein BirA [Slackia heliotrinireducens]
MAFDITYKQTTGSTNDDVWDLAQAGAPQGTCVAAFEQTAGRGKWDRVWVGPRGGLYFSFILRPTTPVSEWPQMSPAIAEAIAKVVREQTGAGADEVWVKLPNDVLCHQGKLCGILLEAKDGVVVVGCGLNVFPPETPAQTDGRNVPAYVSDLGNFVGVTGVDPAKADAHDAYLTALVPKLAASIEEAVL